MRINDGQRPPSNAEASANTSHAGAAKQAWLAVQATALRFTTRLRLALPADLPLLLLASGVLLVLWSLAVPIFEAPDEPDHWQYARYVHDNRRLPIYGPDFIEANSPPLYYLLIAPFATASDVPPRIRHLDSQGAHQSPVLFQHSNADLGKYLPLRIARLVSATMSIVAVFFCYLTGREATGNRRTGLLAASLMAFLPQFSFRGMNVSNDALVTLLGTLGTYLIIRLIRRGFTKNCALVTSVVIALAFLSKANAIFLPVPLVLALWSDQVPWRVRLRRLGVLAPTAAIVLPWLVCNQVLYGDPLAGGAMLTAVSSLVRQKPIWSSYFITTFPYALSRSFVGVFGWMNVWLPELLYWPFGVIAVLAAMGHLWYKPNTKASRRLSAVLATMPLLALMVTVHINLTFTQPQGRYLFPALTAITVLLATGLERLPHWSLRSSRLLAVALAGLNVIILRCIVVPTYWSLPL